MAVTKLINVGGVVRRAPDATGSQLFISAQLPTINGQHQTRATVTADPGLWNETPSSYSYVWLRNGVAIPGATFQSYTLTDDDIGENKIAVRVTPILAGWTGGTHTSIAVTIADPEPPLPEPDPGLFFKKTEATSTRKVRCHWFRYPLSFSSAAPPNYYESGYLAINGESGAHAAYGGLLRDRPITQDLLYVDDTGDHAMPFGGSTAWGVQAARADIEEAMAIGIDGWFHDVLSTSVQNWGIMMDNLNASVYYPGFEIIPMIDCNAAFGKESPSTIAERLRIILAYDCVPTEGGKKVVASYRTENISGAAGNHSTAQANWASIKSILSSTYGIEVTFWHCFGAPPSSQATLAGYTDCTAVGRWGWGGADPAIIAAAATTFATHARGLGLKIFPPIFNQWVRPKYGEFDEALNTRALQAAWDKANALCGPDDFVQICTWNDYSEGHQIAPTKARGYVNWALTAWHIEKFKHGAAPRIAADAIFVTHRNQLPNASITGGQTTMLTQRSNAGRSAFRNHVEVVLFLTAPDTVTVTIGSMVYVFNAQAGQTVWSAPAVAGTVTVTTGRGETATSPVPIRSSSGNQDRNYVGTYSRRTSAMQGDPTPA